MNITRRSLFAMLFVAPFAKVFVKPSRRYLVYANGEYKMMSDEQVSEWMNPFGQAMFSRTVSGVRVNGRAVPCELTADGLVRYWPDGRGGAAVINDESRRRSTVYTGSRQAQLALRVSQASTPQEARSAFERFNAETHAS